MITLKGFLVESEEDKLVTEAFNSAPYELTFGKKSAGDVFFTFVDEDDKEFRIQFYTPQGLGKSVRQVFIGQKRGASYLDANQKFKNPMRVIATLIEAMKQFLQTPLGKSIDGYAVNFSKKAFERGVTLIPKVIRQSGLKQKLNVMDLTFTPDDSRGYIWVLKKGMDPANVFNGPKLKGVTWDDPDKVGDVPTDNVLVADNFGQFSVMADTAGIFSSEVKVQGDQIILGSKEFAISVHDGAMAKVAKAQSIAQVTVFDKKFTGKGVVKRVDMRASDRQGKGWELSSMGKVVAYIEFGIGAVVTGSSKNAADLVKAPNSTLVKMRVEAGVVVLSSTIPNYNTNIDGWTIEKRIDANISTNKMSYNIRVMDERGMRKSTFDSVMAYQEGLPQNIADKFADYISNVTGQLSHVNHDAYNPFHAKLEGLVINEQGTVLLNGADLGSRGSRDAVLNKLTTITKAAEATAKADRLSKAKIPVLTITEILQKLESMTTKTSNVDWQIFESNGKITAEWDLTFRRNTMTGAFMEYQSEATRANGALVNMESFLKGLGYKTDSFIFTLQDAKNRDALADEAYSEYEQSFGGSVTGTK